MSGRPPLVHAEHLQQLRANATGTHLVLREFAVRDHGCLWRSREAVRGKRYLCRAFRGNVFAESNNPVRKWQIAFAIVIFGYFEACLRPSRNVDSARIAIGCNKDVVTVKSHDTREIGVELDRCMPVDQFGFAKVLKPAFRTF